MAEEGGEWRNPGELFWEVLIVIALLGAALALIRAIWQRIVDFFSGAYADGGGFLAWLYNFLVASKPFLIILAIILSAIFLMGIIYFSREINRILAEMRAPLYPAHIPEEEKDSDGIVPQKNLKWEQIVKHIESEHPNDWKVAILEADILLDEMLDVIGYRGDTMSDKLKQVERSDFLTIDKAWEAHKIRNQIAHEGAEFLITEREARRVIRLYQDVFEEFKYI